MASKKSIKRATSRLLLKARTSVAAVVAAAIILILPFYNQPPVTKLTKTQFDASKMLWNDAADVLLIGDSRTYITIDSEMLAKQLEVPTDRVLNAGMSGQNYTTAYLDYAERVLASPSSSASSYRTIVLGLTAYSLTDPELDQFSGYDDLLSHTWLNLHLERDLPWYTGIEPIWPGELPGILGFGQPPKRITESEAGRSYLPSGFCASEPTRYDESVCLKEYEEHARQGLRVHRPTLEKVCQRIEEWTSKGIIVYAFRPPSCPSMDKLENESLGWDEHLISESVKRAGGYWLDLDRTTDIRSYDGSHIDLKSAKVFTTRLANAIVSASPDQVRRSTSTRPTKVVFYGFERE